MKDAAAADHVQVLSILQEPQVVDWIERRLSDSAGPITVNWGDAAAWSGISWTRIRSRLERGRPLSPVALDTLANLSLKGRNAPRLLDPDEVRVMDQVVQEVARNDPVPRVEKRVAVVRSQWERICGREDNKKPSGGKVPPDGR
jgi:hypothetical protein